MGYIGIFFFFSSRRRHTRSTRDWSSDVCSSDLGGRAEQVVLEEVALVADDDQVEVSFAGVADDQLGGVPGQYLYLEIDPFLSRLVACEAGDRAEELVLLALYLVDLADRRRVGGKLPFEGE